MQGKDGALNPARQLIVALVLAIGAFASFTLATDPDLWWHMATGRWILENGRFPDTDPFSQGGEARPLEAYSWLFEVGVYGLYQCGGLFLIALVEKIIEIIIGAIFLAKLRRYQGSFLPWIGLGLLGLLVMAPVMRPRPWLFSILGVFAVLEVLERERRGQRRALFVLPAIFAVWANLHIQFIYGLILIAIWALEPLFVVAWARKKVEDLPLGLWERARWLSLAGLGSALAALCNPYGWRVYETIVLYAGQSQLYDEIVELRALDFNSGGWTWLVLGLAALAFYAEGRRSFSCGRGGRFLSLGLLSLATLASFRMGRDAWLLVIFGSFSVCGAFDEPRAPREARGAGWARLAGIAALCVLVASCFCLFKDFNPTAIARRCRRDYPVAAVDWLRRSGLRGPIYNDFGWGGYLIWAAPEFPVAMDGRTNVHGEERARRSIQCWREGDPRRDPELAGAAIILGNKAWPLTQALQESAEFERVYEDSNCVVLRRR